MPPRKRPNPQDSAAAPITPSPIAAPTATASALTTLPETIAIQYPDFGSQLPSNWFRPSSANIERITDAEFQEEDLIGREQGNALDLQLLNLTNAEKTIRNAVKATKVGKLIAEYSVGLEEIRAVGVRLRNAQFATANEEKRILITQQKGVMLDRQLANEQLRTTLEGRKGDLIQSEIGYYDRLLLIKEQEWQNKLKTAQLKAQQALEGISRSSLPA